MIYYFARFLMFKIFCEDREKHMVSTDMMDGFEKKRNLVVIEKKGQIRGLDGKK